MSSMPDEWFPTYPSEGWILDEDRALRDHLKGVMVQDHEQPARNVEVWFGHPDQEMREQKFPYITLDLINVQEGLDRVARGELWIADPPAWWGLEPLTGEQVGYLLEMPTPIDLDYQISTWARNPRHDRQIISQLMNSYRIPPRGGLLFTADRKNRRLDFLGHFKRDTTENGKRLFNNIYRVRVSSEIPWGARTPPTTETGGSVRYGLTTKVGIGIIAKVEESINATVDRKTIEVGIVTVWHATTRTVDLDIKGEVVTEVPITTAVYGDFMVGDVVAVSKHPKYQGATALTDHHLLVLGLEVRKGEGA